MPLSVLALQDSWPLRREGSCTETRSLVTVHPDAGVAKLIVLGERAAAVSAEGMTARLHAAVLKVHD